MVVALTQAREGEADQRESAEGRSGCPTERALRL
jgi:hypothetical protein